MTCRNGSHYECEKCKEPCLDRYGAGERRRTHLVWDPIDGEYRRFEWNEDAEMWVEV